MNRQRIAILDGDINFINEVISQYNDNNTKVVSVISYKETKKNLGYYYQTLIRMTVLLEQKGVN